ncbi:MAG TPA: hypothetical protein VGD67_23775 [Pseudonocardiaceae bacterium]
MTNTVGAGLIGAIIGAAATLIVGHWTSTDAHEEEARNHRGQSYSAFLKAEDSLSEHIQNNLLTRCQDQPDGRGRSPQTYAEVSTYYGLRLEVQRSLEVLRIYATEEGLKMATSIYEITHPYEPFVYDGKTYARPPTDNPATGETWGVTWNISCTTAAGRMHTYSELRASMLGLMRCEISPTKPEDC